MSDKHYICSSDLETINNLKSLGFEVIEEKNGMVTFLNKTNKKVNFENPKLVYTNKRIM